LQAITARLATPAPLRSADCIAGLTLTLAPRTRLGQSNALLVTPAPLTLRLLHRWFALTLATRLGWACHGSRRLLR